MKCEFNEIKRKIFVYGTLKRGYKNSYYLDSSRKIGEGYIEGFVMYGLEKSFPFIIKSDDKKKLIKGEIYEVTERVWNDIKKLEDNYVSTKVEVITNGLSHECFVYIMEDKERIDKWINHHNFKEIESGNWDESIQNRFDAYLGSIRPSETPPTFAMSDEDDEDDGEEDDDDYD